MRQGGGPGPGRLQSWKKWMNREIPQTKIKPRIFDSAVALFAECVFYFESLLVSALIKIHTLVEIPSRSERRE